MAVAGTYNFYLVALSVAVACFASYTALDLGTRIRAAEGRAWAAWLMTAAVAMGGGIWSMHFIAIDGFKILRKPFDLHALAAAIEELKHEPQPA